MSSKKRKSLPTVEEAYERIKDLVLTAKTKLDNVNNAVRLSLVDDLQEITTHAEIIIELRPKSNKSLKWPELTDNLDREGVNLWNSSGVLNRSKDHDGRVVVGALRLAGFRLVHAGLESKPGIETLLHILQLASKTGSTLSELGNHGAANSVLTSAAEFEEAVNGSSDELHQPTKSIATVVYLSTRMEAAWREQQMGVADMMLKKIENYQGLNRVPPHVLELLASKVGEIGKSLLAAERNTDGVKAADAVRWLQKGLAITEKLDETITPGVPELKISILRSLAKAYFLSASDDPENDNLSRAEATLADILPSLDASDDHASSEYQVLRWQRLAVLKRKKSTSNEALLDAFKSIIDHMVFSETAVTDVLQELRSYTKIQQHVLITAVTQHFLNRALGCHETGSQFVDRLVLSLIFHCSKDENHPRAMKDVEEGFTRMCEYEFELPSVPAVACLTLIWKYGDREYKLKKWTQAAEWFLAGSHKVFQVSSPTSHSKCLRKAALCYLEQKQYAMTETVIRRCPLNQASTHYVLLLAAVHRRLEDDAIKAVIGMTEAPDFDQKMLLLATHISHDLEMKSLLVTVLKYLLKTVKTPLNGETALDAMTVIRCIIKLVLKLLVEPGANQPVLINTLVDHFHTAKQLVESAVDNKVASMIVKEISWLWRTSYNTAVQGCAEWEASHGSVSTLFEISRDVLEIFCDVSPIDVDVELHLCMINASFSAVSGRVFAAREEKKPTVDSLRAVAADIEQCRTRIQAIFNNDKITQPDDMRRVSSFLHVLRVFATEVLVQLKDWEAVDNLVREVTNTDVFAVPTYSAIADILWIEKDCPVPTLHLALETILHASLDRSSLSVEKFARWLRAVCTILLATNTAVNRATAVGYVQQAVTVIEESQEGEGDETYPMEERMWLLTTAYNTGIECLHASLLDEAKRWFEASTVICRFVPDGKTSAAKISEQYTQLLARYTRS